jgi:hypothetical protein
MFLASGINLMHVRHRAAIAACARQAPSRVRASVLCRLPLPASDFNVVWLLTGNRMSGSSETMTDATRRS